MPPTVTVLMPVYNGMRYLREAVDSVFSQTCTEFEFLIIDDASTDDSHAYLQSLTDRRIRLVRNQCNIGQAATLMRGLELARGRYIARLDQDDVCLPERLEKQTALLDERPDVAVASTWEHSIDAAGRRIRTWRSDIPDYGVFLGTIAVGKCPVWHPSAMIRASAAAAVGGFDARFALAEDFDLWLKLALARQNAAIVPHVLVLQRAHSGSQSAMRAAAQRDSLVRSHQKLVMRFSPRRHAEAVGWLMRMDDALWARRWTKADLLALSRALRLTLDNMREELRLSETEGASLDRIVYRRLGPGVLLAERLAWLPPSPFRAAFFALSPRLSPSIRRASSACNSALHGWRRPVRAAAAAWTGRHAP